MNADFDPITIRKCEGGGWEVMQNGLTTGQLCLGEMLEMVLKLAEPSIQGPLYTMKSQEEWDAR